MFPAAKLLLPIALGGVAVGLWLLLSAPSTPAPGPVAPVGEGATELVPATAPAAVSGPAPVQRVPLPPVESGESEAQGVRGQVLDPQRRAMAGLRVVLVESPTNDLFPLLLAAHYGMPVLPIAAGTTDANGHFALGVRSVDGKRAYDLRVFAADYPDASLSGIVLRPGDWYDAQILSLQPGTPIRGRITIAGTQLPVPQAFVTLQGSGRFDDVLSATLPGSDDGMVAAADASGFFTLHKAPRSGMVSLAAVAPGFARAQKTQIELHGAPVEINFELVQGLQLEGSITDVAGTAIAGARVQVWPQKATDSAPFIAFSDREGHFTVLGLRDGPHRLVADATGFQQHHEDLQLAANGPWRHVEMARRGGARVRVLGRAGEVLDRYMLGVRRWYPSGGGQIGNVVQVADRSIRPADLLNGYATIEGLDPTVSPAPGAVAVAIEYVFQIQAEGYAKTLSPPFTLRPDEPQPTLDVAMSDGATLQGRIVDAQGRPIADATVRTEPPGASEDNMLYRMLAGMAPDKITKSSTTTDQDGYFRLALLALGDYQLRISAAEYCETLQGDLQLTEATAHRLPPIRLERGARVLGTATLDGRPAGQIKVVVTAAGPDQDPARGALQRGEAISNNDGSFELPRRLPPGNYQLRAAQKVGDQQGADFFRQLQQLQKSAQPLTVLAGQELVQTSIHLTTDH